MHTELYKPSTDQHAQIIALHCSGAGASQWDHFAAAIGDDYEVLTPEHYGSESSGPWTGEHAFTIADEAATTLDFIDASSRRVHLVGHSYGGGVALHVALARPQKVASMALYEPTAFHLLRHLGEPGPAPSLKSPMLRNGIPKALSAATTATAMSLFVDYWNGPGAWNAMRPSAQKALIRWAPKGSLDFRALIENGTPPSAYGRLRCPVLSCAANTRRCRRA